MLDFTKHFATRLKRQATPQSEPIPGSDQIPNSAGGWTWAVDPWKRFDRFLIFGTERGTYYIRERQLTRENAVNAIACIAADGPRAVRRIVEISTGGRAPSNDPALFALALAASAEDAPTRAAAFAALPEVARTGTHLFHWVRYLQGLRGWGRGPRTAVAQWYTARPAAILAYQLLKYRSRDGWSHRDTLRLAHPVPPSATHDYLFRYATRQTLEVGSPSRVAPHPDVVTFVEAVASLARLKPDAAAKTIAEHRLTREMVPTELLTHASVWEALLASMPLTAMIRNLGVMSASGLLVPHSDAATSIVARLRDRDALRAARIHPIAVLAALKTYAQGRGMRGKKTWDPVPQIVDALDAAFYATFVNAPTTNRRIMLALDVSGSMTAPVFGMDFLSCREASAAMALVTAATEPHHQFVAFTAGKYPSRFPGHPTGLTRLNISPRQRLDDVIKLTANMPFGGTDCALPMVEAANNRWPVDVFVVLTDNETWAGAIHPAEALRQYRQRMGIAAKLVVVAMTANEFTIADPDDLGMLDVVGFDPSTAQLIAEF
ncbi:MAG TPA: TROVE domain-containing protein [Gemmatimonadaceae bacterium]|nr:TROVE domain-containing protein [Gemmatimonadaceae bacterium]